MKLLICSDGSEQADAAINFGGLIARASRAETTILGIAEKSEEEDEVFDALKRGRDLLKEKGVSAELIIKAGNPIDEIVKRAEETHYDLVVIGAVRKGTRGSFLMSAKAYKIIKAVGPPVLVVIGNRSSLKRILICSGGEKYIDTAVAFAGRIAGETGAGVTLLHVMVDPPEVFSDLLKMEEDVNLLLHSGLDLGHNLRREKEELDQMGVESQVKLRHGLVLSEVFKEIRQGDYDLVVTGSSPDHGNLRAYILGNLTREIVNRADCPVLVVRSQESPASIGQSLRGFLSQVFSRNE